eukprot:69859_1
MTLEPNFNLIYTKSWTLQSFSLSCGTKKNSIEAFQENGDFVLLFLCLEIHRRTISTRYKATLAPICSATRARIEYLLLFWGTKQTSKKYVRAMPKTNNMGLEVEMPQ